MAPLLFIRRGISLEDPIGRWLIVIALLFLSAILSCAQKALKHANESKLKEAAEENKRLKKAAGLPSHPRAGLAVRGVKTLCLLLIAAFGAGYFLTGDQAQPWKAWVFCLAAMPVVMVLAKLVPEKIGKKHAEGTLIRLRHLILFLNWVMTPLTVIIDSLGRGVASFFGINPHAPEEEVTEEGIRAMVDIGEESGVIESEEREMIENVFEFGDMTAAQCMTHRTNVTAIWLEDDQETILNTIRETGLSRFPVCNEDIDDVVGILATRDYLLNMGLPNPKPMEALLREAYFVPETVKTDVLLRNMQHAKTHIAIVVDEYGGVSGLITMEDLLEEIVGKIYDEFDPADETEIQPLSADLWRISGAADLDAVAEALDVKAPETEDYDTLGGWIFSRFSTIPQDGTTPHTILFCTPDGEEPEEGDCDKLEIQVEKIEDHRMAWAKVHLIRKKTEEDETEEEDEKE